MERLYPTNACHFFVACRPERSKAPYAIDFSSSTFLDYVPELRKGCGLEGPVLFRPDWRTELDAAQLPFVLRVDGRRSIDEIAMAVARDAGATRAQLEDAEAISRELFGLCGRLTSFGLLPR